MAIPPFRSCLTRMLQPVKSGPTLVATIGRRRHLASTMVSASCLVTSAAPSYRSKPTAVASTASGLPSNSFSTLGVEGRIGAARADCQCGKRDGEGKLRFLEVAGERREAAQRRGRSPSSAARSAVVALCAPDAPEIASVPRRRDRRPRSAWRWRRQNRRARRALPEATLASLGIGRGAALFGMLARFQHEERGARAADRRRRLPSRSRSHSGRQAPRCR